MIKGVKKVQDLIPVKHAFISLFNKEQSRMLVEQLFAICPGLKIFASGGTYDHLAQYLKGRPELLQLVKVEDYTGQPETDGGLVKTLHHKLFLGYLTEQFNQKHSEDLAREGAFRIDLVIIDLYPFEKVMSANGSTIEDCRGNIDVGGPSALRAAAKNYLRVMTVPQATPVAYDNLIAEINTNRGHTTLSMRIRGAQSTFNTLANYDSQVSRFYNGLTLKNVENFYEIVH